MVMLQLSVSYGKVDDLPDISSNGFAVFFCFASGSYARIRYIGWEN